MPVTDHLIEYAVKLIVSTRPKESNSSAFVNEYISWGAGPRASQAIVIAAKAHAAIHGKYSPDIEDVKAVALPILRHRIMRNFKAEAEDISIETIVSKIM